ncbi:MAG: hypothetical protein M1818_006791 [Claussenomyces sp. TS43310]|nr:MAG: hypothetical protein M1818_006791 [Claussenomyces sp. TS43310]
MPPRLNIPPITRILLIGLVTLSTLSAVIRYRQWTKESDIVVPYISLIPQLSLIYPWTFLSTTLCEGNVFTLGVSGATFYYGGKYLERAWSSIEFAKFLLVVTLIPNVLCFAILVALFAMTGNMAWTLTSISGGIPLHISFLVAFSQIVPAHTVTLFRGIISLRVPRFPLIYLVLVTLLVLTPILTSASFFSANIAFLTSWIYLRFYKSAFPDLETSQPSSLRGDASETFAFSEFFPDPIRGPVATVSDSIYQIFIALHICVPFSAADISASRGESFMQRSAPGSTRAETERRRALALKALDQRLSASMTAKTPQPASAGPSTDAQPKAVAQNVMTSQPSNMLGETSYVPDNEGIGAKGTTQD